MIRTFKANPDKGRGFGTYVSFHPQGNQLVIGNDNRTAVVYQLPDGEEAYRLASPEAGWCGGCATMARFSPDGRWLLTAANNGPIKVMEVSSGKTTTLRAHVGEVRALEMHPSQPSFLLATPDSLLVMDLTSGKKKLQIRATHTMPVTAANTSIRILFTASKVVSIK